MSEEEKKEPSSKKAEKKREDSKELFRYCHRLIVAIEHASSLCNPSYPPIQASLNSHLIPQPFSFFSAPPAHLVASVMRDFDETLGKGDWNPFIQKTCGKLRKEVWEKLSEKFPVCLNILNVFLDNLVLWMNHETIIYWACSFRLNYPQLIAEFPQVISSHSRQVRNSHSHHRDSVRSGVSAVTARKIDSRDHQNQEKDWIAETSWRIRSMRRVCEMLWGQSFPATDDEETALKRSLATLVAWVQTLAGEVKSEMSKRGHADIYQNTGVECTVYPSFCPPTSATAGSSLALSSTTSGETPAPPEAVTSSHSPSAPVTSPEAPSEGACSPAPTGAITKRPRLAAPRSHSEALHRNLPDPVSPQDRAVNPVESKRSAIQYDEGHSGLSPTHNPPSSPDESPAGTPNAPATTATATATAAPTPTPPVTPTPSLPAPAQAPVTAPPSVLFPFSLPAPPGPVPTAPNTYMNGYGAVPPPPGLVGSPANPFSYGSSAPFAGPASAPYGTPGSFPGGRAAGGFPQPMVLPFGTSMYTPGAYPPLPQFSPSLRGIYKGPTPLGQSPLHPGLRVLGVGSPGGPPFSISPTSAALASLPLPAGIAATTTTSAAVPPSSTLPSPASSPAPVGLGYMASCTPPPSTTPTPSPGPSPRISPSRRRSRVQMEGMSYTDALPTRMDELEDEDMTPYNNIGMTARIRPAAATITITTTVSPPVQGSAPQAGSATMQQQVGSATTSTTSTTVTGPMVGPTPVADIKPSLSSSMLTQSFRHQTVASAPLPPRLSPSPSACFSPSAGPVPTHLPTKRSAELAPVANPPLIAGPNPLVVPPTAPGGIMVTLATNPSSAKPLTPLNLELNPAPAHATTLAATTAALQPGAENPTNPAAAAAARPAGTAEIDMMLSEMVDFPSDPLLHNFVVSLENVPASDFFDPLSSDDGETIMHGPHFMEDDFLTMSALPPTPPHVGAHSPQLHPEPSLAAPAGAGPVEQSEVLARTERLVENICRLQSQVMQTASPVAPAAAAVLPAAASPDLCGLMQGLSVTDMRALLDTVRGVMSENSRLRAQLSQYARQDGTGAPSPLPDFR
ncbi:hypothetical protein PAPYR_11686 [Paratrimastix pyriformis]|uniref:Uncharacterized protein n=1 Tax=Paratrimastix pyriformis TaxID=342808 RepID=A0ABQ8U8S6_9EUKA|nr:hypothetical protein PAPYR_11686 [Paratrimastix pyriformis]